MKKISLSDKVFATVSFLGRTILNCSFEGIDSLEELIRRVSRAIDNPPRGFLTLTIRNSTQGWANKTHLRLVA